MIIIFFFFFSSRRRHTRYWRDWSSDVCSSDLEADVVPGPGVLGAGVAEADDQESVAVIGVAAAEERQSYPSLESPESPPPSAPVSPSPSPSAGASPSSPTSSVSSSTSGSGSSSTRGGERVAIVTSSRSSATSFTPSGTGSEES